MPHIEYLIDTHNLITAFIMLGSLAAFMHEAIQDEGHSVNSLKELWIDKITTIFHIALNFFFYLWIQWGVANTQIDSMRFLLKIIELGNVMYLAGHCTELSLALISYSVRFTKNKITN